MYSGIAVRRRGREEIKAAPESFRSFFLCFNLDLEGRAPAIHSSFLLTFTPMTMAEVLAMR
jgi:hypothetical protein